MAGVIGQGCRVPGHRPRPFGAGLPSSVQSRACGGVALFPNADRLDTDGGRADSAALLDAVIRRGRKERREVDMTQVDAGFRAGLYPRMPKRRRDTTLGEVQKMKSSRNGVPIACDTTQRRYPIAPTTCLDTAVETSSIDRSTILPECGSNGSRSGQLGEAPKLATRRHRQRPHAIGARGICRRLSFGTGFAAMRR